MTDVPPPADGAAPQESEHWPAIGTTFDKNVPWYRAGPPRVPAEMRELLEQYSGVPPAEVESHVEEMVPHPHPRPRPAPRHRVPPHLLPLTPRSQREKAWAVHPYPCIGRYRFLELSLAHHPGYPRILARLRAAADPPADPPPLLLDLGCCLGQDLRKLRHDGAPAEALRGAELRGAFVALGHALFRDAAGLPAETHFVVGDVLDPAGAYPALRGQMGMLHAASFLHLWDWEGQVDVASRMVGLMADRPGVVMLGRDIGNVEAGYKRHSTTGVEGQGDRRMWRHDVASCERMWREVGERTGTEWRVTATLEDTVQDAFDTRWHDPGTRRLVWEVERI